MDGISLRDIAAIWGAGLSTLLALSYFLPARPYFHLEPGEMNDLRIRIVNPARDMVFVREWFRFRLGGSETALGVFSDGSRFEDMGRSGTVHVGIPGEGSGYITVNTLKPGSIWLVVLRWRRQWLLPIWIPKVVFLSGHRAAEMKAAHIPKAPAPIKH